MSRRKGRRLAVQALYSYDVGGVPLDDLLRLEWKDDLAEDGMVVPPGSEDFARLLISGTVGQLPQIDKVIKSHLSATWDFDRVNRLTLAILRVSVFTLLYQKDVAPSVVIDEAILISKEFGSDDSFKFINAVLDTVRKEQAAAAPQEC